MISITNPTNAHWEEKMITGSKQGIWMAEVANRPASMTQRSLAVVQCWEGGVELLLLEAKKHNIHLAQLTDDRGAQLIIASKHSFTVLA